MPDVHAKFSPSSFSRTLECVASLIVTPPGADTGGAAANEGTAAHTLLQKCLIMGTSAGTYVGQVADPKHPEYLVTAEMVEAVDMCIAKVQEEKTRMGEGARLMVEKFIQHPAFMEPGERISLVAGTRDVALRSETESCVIDFKYGKGIVVPPNDPQLIGYAILECVDRAMAKEPPPQVLKCVVVQPRATHAADLIREHQPSSEELMGIATKLQLAVDLYKQYKGTDPPEELYAPSEEACRFCPVVQTCPVARKAAGEMARLEFPDVMATVDVEQALRWKAAGAAVKKFLKFVDEYLESQAVHGVEIPNHKLIAAYSNRKWGEDHAAIIKRLSRGRGDETKLLKKEVTETVLMSPTKIENLLKARKEWNKANRDLISGLTERTITGVRLVEASQHGAPIDPVVAQRILAGEQAVGLQAPTPPEGEKQEKKAPAKKKSTPRKKPAAKKETQPESK